MSTRQMIIWKYANHAYRKALRILNRFSVPVTNVYFRQYARKFPDKFLLEIDRAIENGIAYFEKQETITLDAALGFNLIINRTFEPKLACLDEKIRSYAEDWNDPHLRLLDKNYDPSKRSGERCKPVDLDKLHNVEKPIVRCVSACGKEEQEKLLRDLEAIDDEGGYGTTHKLLGCVILKVTNPELHDHLETMIESTIAPILKAQRNARASDIFSERTVLLQWLGLDHLVKVEWIMRIMRAQMRNGGWYWNASIINRADQHPSSLGLTALIQYRETKRRKKGSFSAVPSEIGRAFPLIPVDLVIGKEIDG